MSNSYSCIKQQIFTAGKYSIVPIRMEDRYLIMQWRNEQIYHLRQNKPLTNEDQDRYFDVVVASLFGQKKPDQLLFSFLEGDRCIGYGGLVHINWIDRNAELSFIMDTTLEAGFFESFWTIFLKLIEEVAFKDIGLHKIYTYAFDLRPRLYSALDKAAFSKEAVLQQHGYFEGKFIDVMIHSKFNESFYFRNARLYDAELTYSWATDSKVRMYALNQDKIEWENHKIWFAEKLKDKNCEYYILCFKGMGIGSIRFDIEQDDMAMISYLIDSSFHGKGYGSVILEKGVEKLKSERSKVKVVYGIVHKENFASLKIFERLNFQRVFNTEVTYRFEKEL